MLLMFGVTHIVNIIIMFMILDVNHLNICFLQTFRISVFYLNMVFQGQGGLSILDVFENICCPTATTG